MAALEQSQIDFFNKHGYLVVENAVDKETLSELTRDFATWVDESRDHTEPMARHLTGDHVLMLRQATLKVIPHSDASMHRLKFLTHTTKQ